MEPIYLVLIALVVGFLAGLVAASQGKNKKAAKALDAFFSFYMGEGIQNLDLTEKLLAFVEKVMADLKDRNPEAYNDMMPKVEELRKVLAMLGKKKPDALPPDY